MSRRRLSKWLVRGGLFGFAGGVLGDQDTVAKIGAGSVAVGLLLRLGRRGGGSGGSGGEQPAVPCTVVVRADGLEVNGERGLTVTQAMELCRGRAVTLSTTGDASFGDLSAACCVFRKSDLTTVDDACGDVTCDRDAGGRSDFVFRRPAVGT